MRTTFLAIRIFHIITNPCILVILKNWKKIAVAVNYINYKLLLFKLFGCFGLPPSSPGTRLRFRSLFLFLSVNVLNLSNWSSFVIDILWDLSGECSYAFVRVFIPFLSFYFFWFSFFLFFSFPFLSFSFFSISFSFSFSFSFPFLFPFLFSFLFPFLLFICTLYLVLVCVWACTSCAFLMISKINSSKLA